MSGVGSNIKCYDESDRWDRVGIISLWALAITLPSALSELFQMIPPSEQTRKRFFLHKMCAIGLYIFEVGAVVLGLAIVPKRYTHGIGFISFLIGVPIIIIQFFKVTRNLILALRANKIAGAQIGFHQRSRDDFVDFNRTRQLFGKKFDGVSLAKDVTERSLMIFPQEGSLSHILDTHLHKHNTDSWGTMKMDAIFELQGDSVLAVKWGHRRGRQILNLVGRMFYSTGEVNRAEMFQYDGVLGHALAGFRPMELLIRYGVCSLDMLAFYQELLRVCNKHASCFDFQVLADLVGQHAEPQHAPTRRSAVPALGSVPLSASMLQRHVSLDHGLGDKELALVVPTILKYQGFGYFVSFSPVGRTLRQVGKSWSSYLGKGWLEDGESFGSQPSYQEYALAVAELIYWALESRAVEQWCQYNPPADSLSTSPNNVLTTHSSSDLEGVEVPRELESVVHLQSRSSGDQAIMDARGARAYSSASYADTNGGELGQGNGRAHTASGDDVEKNVMEKLQQGDGVGGPSKRTILYSLLLNPPFPDTLPADVVLELEALLPPPREEVVSKAEYERRKGLCVLGICLQLQELVVNTRVALVAMLVTSALALFINADGTLDTTQGAWVADIETNFRAHYERLATDFMKEWVVDTHGLDAGLSQEQKEEQQGALEVFRVECLTKLGVWQRLYMVFRGYVQLQRPQDILSLIEEKRSAGPSNEWK